MLNTRENKRPGLSARADRLRHSSQTCLLRAKKKRTSAQHWKTNFDFRLFFTPEKSVPESAFVGGRRRKAWWDEDSFWMFMLNISIREEARRQGAGGLESRDPADRCWPTRGDANGETGWIYGDQNIS
jgi:hypothetical protein